MPYSSYNSRNYHRPRTTRKRPRLLIGLAVALLVVIGAWLIFKKDKPEEQVTNQEVAVPSAPEAAPAQPSLPNLQPLVDNWVESHGGTYAVTITDVDGNKLAETNGNEQYFTASIYKLYVAYVGYQKIDDGTHQLNDPYLNGWSRGKCLDEMIRTSHSPCAEKLWAELGKEAVTTKMKSYGLTNTSLTGLYTSSNDAAIILSRLQRGVDLKPASTSAMLASMKDQIYRDALPSGFVGSEVYDKVGFRGEQEYHDTAIVKLSNGKTVIVSVLTDSAGSKNIAGLASAIQKALQ